MRTDPIGLYVHIPFCLRKCRYCDFCSFADFDKKTYIRALLEDIDSYRCKGITVDTVFFGGGTPSLFSGYELSLILNHIREVFDLTVDAEITLEANPKTLTEENLNAYVSAGVNRISLGLQTIHENELKKLGRIHNFDDFLESYNMVRASGIKNINVDLMYGIPDQTMKSFSETLHKVIALSPEHLSVYGLILEEGTPLYEQRDELTVPTEDEECDMYYLALRTLFEAGYSHYEVSNYAKADRQCRHNLKYWRNGEFIGVGISAYSYFDGKRFGKTRDMSHYLSDPTSVSDCETIDEVAEKYEYVMMRTRLSEGFLLEDYLLRFKEDFISGREEKIKSLIDLGYVKISEGRFYFTDQGMYVGNSLLTELI